MKIEQFLVSRKQAFKLKELGFNYPTPHYLVEHLESEPKRGKRFNCLAFSSLTDWNNVKYDSKFNNKPEYPYISVPTVYAALQWLDDNYPIFDDKLCLDYSDWVGKAFIVNRYKRLTMLRTIVNERLKILDK